MQLFSMKKYIIALFMGFSAMLQAQNVVSGIVTDSIKQPLIGVSVYVPELHKGTITDANGKYLLKNLPNGVLKISFQYVGYANWKQPLFIWMR
jgi:iron complex outermembrane receptor protein